jgi:hypothetical protein
MVKLSMALFNKRSRDRERVMPNDRCLHDRVPRARVRAELESTIFDWVHPHVELTLALLAVLALTGSALAQISEWHGGTVDKKGTSRFLHHPRQLPTTVALCGRTFSPRSKISRWHRRYLSVI